MSNPQPSHYRKQFVIINLLPGRERHNGKSQHAGGDSVTSGRLSLALQIPNLSQCMPVSRIYHVCGQTRILEQMQRPWLKRAAIVQVGALREKN